MSYTPQHGFGMVLLALAAVPPLTAVPPSTSRPPNVNIVTPANGEAFPPGSNIQLGANAPDDGRVLTLEFFANETKIGDSRGPLTTPMGAWLLTWTNPPANTYLVTARATDDDGNVATSLPVTVTVRSEPVPTSSLYRIISGTYNECCSISSFLSFYTFASNNLRRCSNSGAWLTTDPRRSFVSQLMDCDCRNRLGG